MKNRPALLAALATSLLISIVAMLIYIPALDAGSIEPRQAEFAARMDALGVAPSPVTLPDDPTPMDARPTGRTSLASVPIVGEPTEATGPARAIAGLTLQRWPDGVPLAGIKAEIFGSPGLAIRKYETSASGRVALDVDADGLPLDVHILAEGFERGEARIDSQTPWPIVMLRPLEGWYGRVLSVNGEPLAEARVSGWWIETARPFGDATLKTRRKQAKEDDAPTPADDLPSDFVSSQGAIVATTTTNDEGYYYIEPLEADVRGELTLVVADHPDASSDVLREAIPRPEPRLPDIVMHRPRQLHGLVVNRNGRPIDEAVVICRLERGWSPDLFTLRTDEAGEFVLDQPNEPIVLSLEKTGYSFAGGAPEQLESADGMWRALAAMGKQYGHPANLFSQAYGVWATTLLPRARPVVTVAPTQSDIRLVMHRRGRFSFYVFDPGAGPLVEPGIADARIRISYGGLDANATSVVTRADGSAMAPAVDLAWQPMLVRVEADGFLPQQTIVPLGETHLDFGLTRLDDADEDSANDGTADEDGLVGQVGGLLPNEKAQLVVYHVARSERQRPIIWSGETLSGGRFKIDDWLTLSRLNRYIFAYIDAEPHEHRSRRRAGMVGPIPPHTTRSVALPIEPAVPMTLHLGRFDADTPHRMQVSYAPFVGATIAMDETLDLSRAPSWGSAHTVHVPHGWTVRALVERQLEENVPIVDFLRSDRRQTRFKSLTTTWTDWIPASETALMRYGYGGAHLFVRPPAMVGISGSVEGLPPNPPPLRVAALGPKSHWISAVSPNGWFEFPELPSGQYRLLLYSPPDTGAGFSLADEGAILGSLRVNCIYSRNDLLLPWHDE